MFVDPLGLAYKTIEEAAKAALCEAYPLSILNDWEYGGRLVEVDGEYDYTKPITSMKKADIDIPMQVITTTTKKKFLGIIPYTSKSYQIADNTVGWYHTHGRGGDGDKQYSGNDAWIDRELNIPGWYVDGDGQIRKGSTRSKVGKKIDCTCSP
ncbi:hypothetical protein, partial [Aurantivibrio infirmus]